MKNFLMFVTIIFINSYSKGQSIEGIWIAKYRTQLDNSGNIEVTFDERTARLFDFYNESEFLIYNSYSENTIGKFKKLSDGKIVLKSPPDKKKYIIEFIDSLRFELYPAKIKKGLTEEIVLFEKIDPNLLSISFDSVKSIFTTNNLSILSDNNSFAYLEITDTDRQKFVLYNGWGVNKSSYNLIKYQNHIFFSFSDPISFDNYIILLNDFNGEQFISNAHNFNSFDQNKTSQLILNIEEKASSSDVNIIIKKLLGLWQADVSLWSEEIIIDDEVVIVRNLVNDLELDSVIYNLFEMEFNEDFTYTFINQGNFITDQKEISFSDTITGNWDLSSTLKYIGLESHNLLNENEYKGDFAIIYELNDNSARIGLTIDYGNQNIVIRGAQLFNKKR